MARLVIVRNGAAYQPVPGDTVVAANDVPSWAARVGPLRALLRYREAAIMTPTLAHMGRPFALALVARAATHGPVYIADEAGQRRSIGAADLARWAGQVAAEPLLRRSFVRSVAANVDAEFARLGGPRRRFDAAGFCAFLRTDLSFAVRAGGSVGHIAGVINNLARFGARPVFITTDRVPTVDESIETHLVGTSERFWNAAELPTFVMDDEFGRVAARVLDARPPGWIYQRHSLNNFAGVRLARRFSVPLVVEYNGSEIWVSRHWSGRPLKYEALSVRIEMLNFAAADLVLVVSDPIRCELVDRGVSADKVLVNPNGVDPDAYSPAVDGSGVRARYELGQSLVFGFIGTFGAWHGAEVLAEAYNRLAARRPDLRGSTRLLFIGDGPRLPATRAIVDAGPAPANVRFTGLVAQRDGPAHLAACDVLVSPHVPNVDGSPFFGSPTKLFEYMAMGRPIVASDLAQIGDVLAHGDTAWLVEPGSVESLERGMEALADGAPLREALAARARAAAVARHSWRQHTRRVLDALAEVADATPLTPAAPAATR